MARGGVWRDASYRLQAWGARLALALFGALSIDRASALGGWLGRAIGPHTGISRVAVRNLRRALPEMSDGEAAAVIRGMWDNLGRVFAEYPHLGEIGSHAAGDRIEVIGAQTVDRLRDDDIGGIFFAAHLGNWEIPSLFAAQRGVPLTHIYRAANNPYVEPIIQRLRAPVGGTHHPKGTAGTRELVRSLSRGEHLAMLVDQKLNDGIAVPFFGRDAMTAPALAQLALKYRCPVVPARLERLGGARFRLTILPPMELPDTGDRAADVAETMRRVNAIIEDWIRARPEQWLWLHRRWPD